MLKTHCRNYGIVLPTLIVFSCSSLFLKAALNSATTIHNGDVLYALDLESLAKRPQPLPKGMAVVNEGPLGTPCLRITVDQDQIGSNENNMFQVPIDLSLWGDMQIMLTAKIRTENVSRPAHIWNGVKLQLYYDSPTDGERWEGLNKVFQKTSVFGSFQWKEMSVIVDIKRDLTDGIIQLGLQECSGTVWMTDVRILAWRQRIKHPAAVNKMQPSPQAKNEVNRMRGMMSPFTFKVEDFDALAKWNVNLVRWQLTRSWGAEGTDIDLVEYDQWLDGKLDELSQVLDAANARGIKVLIDLHSPPGGRLEDSTMRIFLEKPYQDHFIATWERIARRFKGHPAVWGYDLVNEPIQNRPSPPGLLDWYGLQEHAGQVIRKIDANTPIIFEVDQWGAPSVFAYIKPINVPRVIYQVHMYQPGAYTHQGVGNAWGESGGKQGIQYPGIIQGKKFDRDELKKCLAPVREFEEAYHVPIYIGEFSVARWAPGAAQYLDDCISIFEEYGWDWTYHAFREYGGWSVEHEDLPYDLNNHRLAEKPTERFLVLKKWLDRNKTELISKSKD